MFPFLHRNYAAAAKQKFPLGINDNEGVSIPSQELCGCSTPPSGGLCRPMTIVSIPSQELCGCSIKINGVWVSLQGFHSFTGIMRLQLFVICCVVGLILIEVSIPSQELCGCSPLWTAVLQPGHYPVSIPSQELCGCSQEMKKTVFFITLVSIPSQELCGCSAKLAKFGPDGP